VALARRFERVIATDPSTRQLDNAAAHPRIEYRNEPPDFPAKDGGGYRTSIDARSIDAITVAQALHWFDLPAFIAEVRRVAKPGALFAAWCYANCSVTPAVDAVIAHLYDDVLGAYWPPERRLVDEGYASLDIPFAPVAAPPFEMRVDWTVRQLLAYLASWSAAQRHLKATGHDAVAAITDELLAAWHDPEHVRPVRWTLAVRAGRITH
jgi:SAM-dependent methyltransferase